jgi:hypothetical protein
MTGWSGISLLRTTRSSVFCSVRSCDERDKGRRVRTASHDDQPVLVPVSNSCVFTLSAFMPLSDSTLTPPSRPSTCAASAVSQPACSCVRPTYIPPPCRSKQKSSSLEARQTRSLYREAIDTV